MPVLKDRKRRTERDVEIRALAASGMPYPQIASRFYITPARVCQIVVSARKQQVAFA